MLPLGCLVSSLRSQPSFFGWAERNLCIFRPSACGPMRARFSTRRSEEHTSELQSPDHLVCRLLLEKKKKKTLNPRLNSTLRLEFCFTEVPDGIMSVTA